MSSEIPGHDDLREGDLLAFLDGAAPAGVAAHIAGCGRCQAELAGLREAGALLRAAVSRSECPAPELLLRLAAGLLDPADARRVRSHVGGCADCAAELALLAAPPAPELPARLALAGRRLVRALLQPQAPPPALALRGQPGQVRRVSYAAEGYTILAAVSAQRPAVGRYQVEGQVLAPDQAAPGTAWLRSEALEEREAEVDALGFFAFDDIAPGVYTLALALAESLVLIEGLEVP